MTETSTSENNATETNEKSYEFNSIYSLDSLFIDCLEDLPIPIEKIKEYARNPQAHIEELRQIYYEFNQLSKNNVYIR